MTISSSFRSSFQHPQSKSRPCQLLLLLLYNSFLRSNLVNLQQPRRNVFSFRPPPRTQHSSLLPFLPPPSSSLSSSANHSFNGKLPLRSFLRWKAQDFFSRRSTFRIHGNSEIQHPHPRFLLLSNSSSTSAEQSEREEQLPRRSEYSRRRVRGSCQISRGRRSEGSRLEGGGGEAGEGQSSFDPFSIQFGSLSELRM